MRVGIATDQGGFGLKEELLGQLQAAGYEVVDHMNIHGWPHGWALRCLGSGPGILASEIQPRIASPAAFGQGRVRRIGRSWQFSCGRMLTARISCGSLMLELSELAKEVA